MNNISQVTYFFVTLIAVGAVTGTVLLGVLAGRLGAQRRATGSLMTASNPAERQSSSSSARRLVATGRRTLHRTAHQH